MISALLITSLFLNHRAAGHYQLDNAEHALLLRHPSLSKSQIAFAFAGDIWTVPKSGGNAVRLTSSNGVNGDPCFSPDGSLIAFSGQYDGNTDVFVVPSSGGQPKRLTSHPLPDTPVGWTPDGKNVIYSSAMQAYLGIPRLYEVSVEGGPAVSLPFPEGTQGAESPDGKQIAYVPNFQYEDAWKRYRGGQTTPIWIANLSDSRVTEIPRKNSNDKNPMWVGRTIYFLSDRSGPFTLYSFDTNNRSVKQLLPNTGFDFKSASASGDEIVYEQLGSLHLYDTQSKQSIPVHVTISGDFPETRPQFKNVGSAIGWAGLSPSGVRAVFEARGDIFTVPAQKGDTRNLTATSDACERYPAWSPDGKSICYFSDASGEYKMVIAPSTGQGDRKDYALGNYPAYYYNPSWSPDSKKIAYSDNHHVLWILDLASGKNTRVDEMPYENPLSHLDARWSPDSKWITYCREMDNHMFGVYLYSLDSGKATLITDGMSDAKSPIFDQSGKALYFTASTNVGSRAGWLNLSSYSWLNAVSSVYVVVLRKDLPSPLEPESDEEKTEAAKPEKPAAPQPFHIDLDGIGQRILALPLPPQNYSELLPGSAGTFFAAAIRPIAYITSPTTQTLLKYSAAERTASVFLPAFTQATVSNDGSKMLVQQGPSWSIVSTAAAPAPGQSALNVTGLMAKVDPLAEWRQMYHEVWRIERDFFYDPHFHGQNLTVLENRYRPFLAGIRSRDDLNYLFTDMLGELTIGHMFIRGGDIPGAHGEPGGLLGADYSLEHGRYRFAKVYNGENWNPGIQATLTQPQVNVKQGDYLLAVGGHNLTSKDDVYQALEGTAGKQVKLLVGPNPDNNGAREVTVVPIANEAGLRYYDWIEGNRRKVAELSGGKVGYVHVPDTNIGGWVNFNRYYYAQLGKDGMVVDDRYNSGGEVDDYLVEMMTRPLMSVWTSRYGKDFTSPLSAIFGPKALVINQYAASGGDYFPWHFRQAKVGPIIGLVGILVFPPLMDGGSVTAPNVAFYNPNGTWDVENHGVDPDIDVELDPHLWREGHDPQLERAVAEVMKRMASEPKPTIKKPAYIDRSKLPPQ